MGSVLRVNAGQWSRSLCKHFFCYFQPPSRVELGEPAKRVQGVTIHNPRFSPIKSNWFSYTTVLHCFTRGDSMPPVVGRATVKETKVFKWKRSIYSPSADPNKVQTTQAKRWEEMPPSFRPATGTYLRGSRSRSISKSSGEPVDPTCQNATA